MAKPYHEQYYEINQGAHNQPANLIGAPALVWHQAIWNPAINWKAGENDEKIRELRASSVKNYIYGLHDRIVSAVISTNNIIDAGDDTALNIAKGKVYPQKESIEINPDDRVRTIVITFPWRFMQATLRIEVHTEYVTITSFIDVSYTPNLSASETNELSKNFNDLFSFFEDNGASRSFNDEIGAYLYVKFWEEFDTQITRLNSPEGGAANSDEHMITGLPVSDIDGGRFADFRGIVSCDKAAINRTTGTGLLRRSRPLNNIFRTATTQPGRPGEAIKFKRPFWDKDTPTEQRARGRPLPYDSPDVSWARERLDRFWPLLESINKRDAGRHEYTASRFLRGRIIYITALGPQESSLGEHTRKERPLFYYIHSVTECERQVGRLIDRINRLGTLRLAALLPITVFKTAGFKLALIENYSSEARALTHGLISKIGNEEPNPEPQEPKPEDPDKKEAAEDPQNTNKDPRKRIVDLLGQIEYQMNSLRLYTPNLIDKSAPKGPNLNFYGTIEYRVARSLYYKDLFNKLSPSLYIERIEGYQQYDEFVTRRLGSAFDFIENLSSRLKIVKAEVRDLYQYRLAQSFSDNEDSLRDIQWFGELILITCILPYYISNTFVHMIDPEQPSGENFIPGMNGHYWANFLFRLLVVIFCSIAAFHRLRKKEHHNLIAMLKKYKKYIIGFLSVLIIYFLYINISIVEMIYSILGHSIQSAHDWVCSWCAKVEDRAH